MLLRQEHRLSLPRSLWWCQTWALTRIPWYGLTNPYLGLTSRDHQTPPNSKPLTILMLLLPEILAPMPTAFKASDFLKQEERTSLKQRHTQHIRQQSNETVKEGAWILVTGTQQLENSLFHSKNLLFWHITINKTFIAQRESAFERGFSGIKCKDFKR